MTVTLDGKRWEPKPGSMVSAREFLQARSLLTHVHQTMCWNPWVLEDRAKEYEAAWQAIGQWQHADPDAHPQTAGEIEAGVERRIAEAQASFEAQQRQAERDRAERAARYDPGREQARLELLEQRAVLADLAAQHAELQQGGRREPEKRWKPKAASLAREITETEREIERLAGVVGDEETVSNATGWLPAERRELALGQFRSNRICEVRELRARIRAKRTELKATKDKDQRATLRQDLREDAGRLAHLEAVPPLAAADMCSECATPAAGHEMATTVGLGGEGEISGPCDAWPKRAAAWRSLREEVAKLLTQPAAPLPAPEPRPLAVISAGLPIEEVMTQLAAVQAEHPGAIVRQGARKRWEIWPASQA